MNKYKRNLLSLRSYLSRDSQGIKLLEAVANDITEQRKRIAELEQSESRAVTAAAIARREMHDAREKENKIKRDLEAEKSKRRAAENLEARKSERIRQLELQADVDDEECATFGGGVPGSCDPSVPKIVALFKQVRKRFKKIPPGVGKLQCFCLEDFVKDFKRDEFTDLGMLLAALAFHNFPARITAEHTITEMKGWEEKYSARFIYWYSKWIATSPLEERVYGPR